MKIYFVTDKTAGTTHLTASELLVKEQVNYMRNKGHEMQVQEGELKTQGQNFHTWAKITNVNAKF